MNHNDGETYDDYPEIPKPPPSENSGSFWG